MTPSPNRSGGMTPALVLFTLLTIAMVVLKVAMSGGTPQSLLAGSDNDDIMRFLSVRDWVSGQGWFDMQQTRVLAPEGISLHWSRYVDAGIAGVMAAAGLFLSDATAVGVGVLAWPTLLLIVLMIATVRSGARLFGAKPAGIAVLSLAVWPLIGNNYFKAARLDHHNVQILLLALVIFTLIAPRPSHRLGLAGGALAALSLAVGLENFLAIALAGIVLAVGATLSPERTGPQLKGFALGLFLGALLFFAGQTALSEWAVAQCDRLSTPFLAITGIALGASLVLTGVAPRFDSPRARVVLLLGLGVVSAALAYPLLQSCAGGPYGALPVDIQAIIRDQIVEAQSTYAFAMEGHRSFFFDVVPLLTAVALATLIWRAQSRGLYGSTEAHRAVGILLIFGWAGALATLFQVRMIVMAAPVVPLLTGYALGFLIDWRSARMGAPLPTLALLTAGAMTLFSPYVYSAASGALASRASALANTSAPQPDACRTASALRTLARLEPGTVLSPLNLGPPILLLSKHDVLSAPYHRSPQALSNGIFPFRAAEAELRETLKETGADYLVLCAGEQYGGPDSFARALAGGSDAPGLTRLTGLDPRLAVFRVAGK